MIGDSRQGIDPAVEFIDMETIGISTETYKRGIFPKLGLYKRGLFPAGSVVLFMDLDMIIAGDLDRFVARVAAMGGTHVLARHVGGLWPLVPERWRIDRGGNTTVIGFIADEDCNLYDAFVGDPETYFRRYANDQDYVTAMAKKLHYWPHGWIVLFRRSLLWPYPLNRVFKSALRPRNRLVNFGGFPKYEDLTGTGELRFGIGWKRKVVKLPVDWIAERWHD
ncbi:MAG: hypothetical protein AAGE80_01800 [Pseudomonadota bacterium]